ncbi:MAG TPA: sulfotransferase [Gaiellaceae bacterium]|nr:sulfotransferase [Gaiellaceae bacterium]
MALPNFLVIGAAKAGTNALYHSLRQHPQVYMSPWKEPKFFAFESPDDLGFRAANGREAPVNKTVVLDRQEYERLFDGARGERALGEASPHYLYAEKAPARIKTLVPDMKLIAVLRNPIDRAFSSFQHLVRDGLEPLAFGPALDAEPARIAENYAFLYRYTDLGFYTRQLDRYAELFPDDRLLILLYDDLRRDPQAISRQVFSFLGVDATFVPTMSEEPNRSGIPRIRLVHRLLNPSAPTKRRLWDATPGVLREPLLRLQTRMVNRNLERQSMPAEERERLQGVFGDEVAQLQKRLGRDLSHWLA